MAAAATAGIASVPATPSPVQPLAPFALRGSYAGPIRPGTRLTLHVTLNGRKQDEIERLIAAQNSPDSPLFRHYLTPAQYGRYFGASDRDYAEAIATLRARGFVVDRLPAGRTGLQAHAPASAVQAFFGTPIEWRSERGRLFFTNRYTPRIPATLHAESVVGLDDYAAFRPHLAGGTPSGGSAGAASAKLAGWTPADLQSAYGLTPVYRRFDGRGVTIVDATLGTVRPRDFAAFTKKFGLHAKLDQIALSNYPPLDDVSESTIDVEWMAAIAPSVTIDLVTADGWDDAQMLAMHSWIVNDMSADHIVSTSWGLCEQNFGEVFQYSPNADERLFAQAQTEGQWWLAAAGDAGSDDCEVRRHGPIAVDYPASSTHVLGVGGTRVTPASISAAGNYTGWSNEVVWNDGPGGGAGGGGLSTLFTMPAFQRALLRKGYMREVPDVALMSDWDDPNGGYVRYFAGAWSNHHGGTSFAAPEWAAFLALVQQRYGSNPIPSPLARLYALAATPEYDTFFHDIVSGCNTYDGVPGYCAYTGYDRADGLGSFVGSALQAAY
jgi:kumamolisin